MKKFLQSDLFARSLSPVFIGVLLTITCISLYAQDYSNLKITEISYHPKDVIEGTDTTDGKDLEFLEFKNVGNDPIELTGLVMDSAVYYEFPNDVLLAPGHFWVVASKPSKFLAYYGKEASGNFSGNLANSGDEILIKDASNNTVIDFIYDDHSPWPEEPDGDGNTLVSVYANPNGNPSDESYWRASYRMYGSPFSDDLLSGTENNQSLSDIINIYPNPSNGIISINNRQIINSLEVHDICGNLVYRADNIDINQTLNLSGNQAGIYIITFTLGDSVSNQKIILK